ncbi:MAG: histidine--tRNA ligase [Nitrospiraceae bacterium]|nr:histidine--tRNA ligase [Nitrospiraceae bacterium]
MSSRFAALKGVEDILPPDSYLRQFIEDKARSVFGSYGFGEIKTPIIEHTDLFLRSIGETSDIVSKEMYTFTDKGGRSITLRPEGTASVVRAYVEHSLAMRPSPQKFYYMGPMFRYERPQKGRQRQFYQIGVEAFGVAEARMDAEVILMLMLHLDRIGLEDLSLELNSIGCGECRPAFKEALRDFFAPKLPELCPDCQRRFETNPLRILDCKVERCIEIRKDAPLVTDYLCGNCRSHFDSLLKLLGVMGVKYTLNPHMVRGLDYYTRTTFEVTTENLGAQKAVAAGGRYDGLVEEFGGPATPAIGFAMGVERLAALLKDKAAPPITDFFVASLGEEAATQALKLASGLRAEGIRGELGYGGSLKSQLRKAGKLGARFAIIIGEDELKSGLLKWKDLKKGESGEVPLAGARKLFA